MKANVELNLKPFTVPNFVVYDGHLNGSTAKDSVPLECLSSETLYDLCQEFVRSVYKKAGKKNVPQFIIDGGSK